MKTHRVFIIVVVIVVMGALYYARPIIFQMLETGPGTGSNTSVRPDPTPISPVTTVYRTGTLPKGFPRELIPVEAYGTIRSRRTAYPVGTVLDTVTFALGSSWSLENARQWYARVLATGGWDASGDLSAGRTIIRATRGSGETLHIVITEHASNGIVVSMVYGWIGQ